MVCGSFLPLKAVGRITSQTKMHECACDIAVQLIHRAVRGCHCRKYFERHMTGRTRVVTHQQAFYLGRWGSLAQHLKRGSKKPPIQPRWKGKENNQQWGMQLR